MKYITIFGMLNRTYIKSGKDIYILQEPVNGVGKGFALLKKNWRKTYDILNFRFIDSMNVLSENFEVGE